MKKISEMTEQEVREYALQLENDKAVTEQTLESKNAEIEELKGFNLDLQKSNKRLFLQVEQQRVPEPTPAPPEPEVEKVEDFVNNNYKEIIK